MMKKVVVNGRWEIELPIHRADREEWYTLEGWEKKRLIHMNDQIKEGDVLYYIGAEEGDMCGLAASWGANLVMIEPNDKVWPNIRAIWNANHFNPPTACFTGFAANKTDLKDKKNLYINEFPPEAMGDVIGDHGFKELAYESDVIPQVKIDDLNLLPPPDIISIDVEGSEFEVLRGAEKTLKEYRPKIYLSLHPEFMFRMFGEYGYDLRNWIKDIGYKETLIDYQHEVHLYYEGN